MTTKEPMPELLPCPFCGGCNIAGHTREFDSHFRAFRRCVDCDFEISAMAQCRQDAESEIDKKWNTRPAPDKIVIDREKLEGMKRRMIADTDKEAGRNQGWNDCIDAIIAVQVKGE